MPIEANDNESIINLRKIIDAQLQQIKELEQINGCYRESNAKTRRAFQYLVALGYVKNKMLIKVQSLADKAIAIEQGIRDGGTNTISSVNILEK